MSNDITFSVEKLLRLGNRYYPQYIRADELEELIIQKREEISEQDRLVKHYQSLQLFDLIL